MAKMKQTSLRNTKFVLVSLMVLCVAVVVLLYATNFFQQKQPAPKSPIRAKVIDYNFTPNEYENGLYALTVVDSNTGESYTIDATGFMNLPDMPGGYDFDCIDPPPRDEIVGKEIEFILPYSSGPHGPDAAAQTVFTTCYDENATNIDDLYLKVVQ